MTRVLNGGAVGLRQHAPSVARRNPRTGNHIDYICVAFRYGAVATSFGC